MGTSGLFVVLAVSTLYRGLLNSSAESVGSKGVIPMEENQAVNQESTIESGQDIAETGLEEDITASSESATEEEKPQTEAETEPTESTEEVVEELTEGEIARLSGKAQRRYRQLANEKADLEKKLAESSLTKQVDDLIPPVNEAAPESTGLPWESADGQPKEITWDQYSKDIAAKAEQLVEQKLAAREAQTNVKQDAAEAKQKYPELNDESLEDYNEDLDRFIADKFIQLQKANPQARLIEFVDQVMELRKQGEQQGKQQTTTKLAEQIAEQAVSTTGESDDEGLSDTDVQQMLKEGKMSLEDFEKRYG